MARHFSIQYRIFLRTLNGTRDSPHPTHVTVAARNNRATATLVATKTKAKRAVAAKPPRARKAQDRRELKKSGVTRQRILDAAARIFAKKGFGRALMSDIAADVRIHVTGLYYHFDTKDALAEAVINHAAEQGYRDVRSALTALPPGTNLRDRMRAAVHAQLYGILLRRDYIMAQSKVLPELPDDIQRRHRKLLRTIALVWRGLFHEAARNGNLRKGFDAGIGRMIMSGSMNWAVEWYRESGRAPREIADQITDTMFDGMFSTLSSRRK